MTSPKLVYAAAIGQSTVRVIFDTPMRELGAQDPRDAVNVANWGTGGGLPAVAAVARLSSVEFELGLVSPAPVAGGYSVTVALIVESGAGEAMDPGFVTYVFAVTTADLTLVSSTWPTPNSVAFTFSEPIATPSSTNALLVLNRQNTDARSATIDQYDIAGAVLTVTISNPLTAGAQYQAVLDRSRITALSSDAILLTSTSTLWGQGDPPTLLSGTAVTDTLTLVSSDLLAHGASNSGWPLVVGDYAVSNGTLGTSLAYGTTPATLKISNSRLPDGNSIVAEVVAKGRVVTAGASWLSGATATAGTGTETTGVGFTTIVKTPGAPFEVVYADPLDPAAPAGRRIKTQFSVAFTPSVLLYPFVTITLLNTQMSVVVMKRTTNDAVLQIYRGANLLAQSVAFNPTVVHDLEIRDATLDYAGFVAVYLDGVVVLGAASTEVLDSELIDSSVSNAALALTFGNPVSIAQGFSVIFSQDLVLDSYMGPGFRGEESRDLLDFDARTLVLLVSSGVVPANPGAFDTGRAAYGAIAEYIEASDAVQIAIALDPEAPVFGFTGSVSLLTASGLTMDQVLVDYTALLQPDREILVTFLHPKYWAGALVGIVLTFDGDDYSVQIPVLNRSAPKIYAHLSRQPVSWYHHRLQNVQDNLGGGFGPATSIETPG